MDDKQNNETIRGTVTQLVFQRDGYVIMKIRQKDAGPRRVTSALGNMLDPLVGQMYEWTGPVTWNPKFQNYEIRFHSYRTILPDDSTGIKTYLANHAKWVGPVTAAKLVDAFGEKTLEVIRENPELVVDLGVMDPVKVVEMSLSLRENARYEAATIEVNQLTGGLLQQHIVQKAVKRWKGDAAERIKENPYILIELVGVSFPTADNVAKKMGTPPDDPERHREGLVFILNEISGEGHTVAMDMTVDNEGVKLLGHPGISPAGWELAIKNDQVTQEGPLISLRELHDAEVYIASAIARMLETPRSRIEIDTFFSLANDQREAVGKFGDAAVFILHGAPGTGKTYTVARIVKALEAHGEVALCAPTGKAAKQLAMAMERSGVPRPAVTIHSLLGTNVDEAGNFSFSYGEKEKLPFSAIVVDECSMVDVRLMRSLLSALRESARLLLVGDNYQLPSVGPGAVLRDLLAAGVPQHELTEIKRNSGEIVLACHAVKAGRMHSPCHPKEAIDENNWWHIETSSEEETRETIAVLLTETLPRLSFDRFADIQTVSPVNDRGLLSCDALNALIKPLLNPATFGEDTRLPFSIGDKVVRTKNANVTSKVGPPTVRVVNGDIGMIRGVDSDSVEVDFSFPDRTVILRRAEHHLRLAYCLTCHKMQGSEVPAIVLPLSDKFSRMPMVSREWFYTAISRAKQLLVTVGDLSVIKPIISKVGNTARQTMLATYAKRLLSPATMTRKEFDYL